MVAASPLKYGIFVMPMHDPAKPLARCFDEDLELAVQCDELGFIDFWVGEHHSSAYETITMPEIFLGKVLAVTKDLRVGPAPVCLQYHHPAHVASRLAFLDHLSHGRLNVCMGPGAIPTDNEVFGIDPDEVGPRISEAIDMILKIWTTDAPYDFPGTYWNVRLSENLNEEYHLGGLQKPLQQPHPPIFVPSMSAGSKGLQLAAAREFRPISHHMLHPDVLLASWKTYCEGAESAQLEADPANWCVGRNILVADSTDEARKLARNNSMSSCIQYIRDFTQEIAPRGLGMWKPYPEMSDEECNLDYFMDQVVIAGDPESVTEQLLELRERIGHFGTLVLTAHDWDDAERWRISLDLFAKEVVPRFNRAIGAN